MIDGTKRCKVVENEMKLFLTKKKIIRELEEKKLVTEIVFASPEVSASIVHAAFPLAHGYFHGKFGAIERLNSLRALTPLLCQSHRDKCFRNFMSSLYIVLFCKIYVTI